MNSDNEEEKDVKDGLSEPAGGVLEETDEDEDDFTAGVNLEEDEKGWE